MRRRFAIGAAAVLLAAASITAAVASTSTAATTTTGPVRAAFYYPWFPETEHWATHYHPALGAYDSSNPTVLAAHVAAARYARLDAFIASWWGTGSKTAQRLPLLLDAARAQAFHVAPYYEPESLSPAPSAATLKADLDTLASEAANESAWLVRDDRPVLFVYNTGTEGSCDAVTRMKTASAGRFYLDLKVFAGYKLCTDQPDSWHQYGPASPYDRQANYSATVSPGFNKFSETSPRLARDLPTFKANLARQVASGTTWQLITTFNEWGEGTAVEPATEWQSSTGYGDYLDAMRAAYAPDFTPPPTTAPSTPTSTPSSAPTTTKASTPPPTSTPPTSSSTPAPSSTPPPPAAGVTKVLVFVEENHSLAQMQAGMPYLYSQAQKYGYATAYKAAAHPSLPNYLAMAFGSTFSVTDDAAPSSHPEAAPDVFTAATENGRTARSYQESMTANCLLTNSGRYAVKHNPWAYDASTSARAACQVGDVPAGTSTSGRLHDDITHGTLPNVGEVTPNLDNDAHDGSLATADAWLKNWLTLIYASPDWASGHLAVIVTADEDANNQGNTVLTTVLHPSQNHHVVTTPLTHYSLTRLLAHVGGAPCVRSGCTAPDLASAFGLPMS